MPLSADIANGDQAVYTQYNNLRADALNLHALSSTDAVAIASGAITVTSTYSYYTLSAESGTADDLDTITAGTGIGAGDIIVLSASTGHIITYGAYTIAGYAQLWLRYSGAGWEVAGGHALRKNLWIGGWQPTMTSGCGLSAKIEMGTNKNVYDYLPFDKDAIEYAYANVPMPLDYDGGTIQGTPYWTHPATTTNFKTSWGLQAVAITDDDTLDVAQGTAQYANDEGGTTSDLYNQSITAAITIAGTPAAGKYINWRCMRKADDATNDTLAVDGYLLGWLITYGVL